jgi:hypothetical protein
MRIALLICLILLAPIACTGCGGRSAATAFVETPIYGRVVLDGQPLAGAIVSFVSTEGSGTLLGLTGADGVFHLQSATASPAARQGHFRVTVSKPLKSDGSPLGPDEPPMQRPGRELVPARYLLSAFTPLEATVGPEGGRFDFALVSP